MARGDSRDRTVRSAALLFRERGVSGTGMREIVEHAGAPRGSLQHHFPGGKEQVVGEAMAWAAERVARRLRAVLEVEPAPAPDRVVAAVFDQFRRLLEVTDYRAGCPIAAAVVDASWDSAAVTGATRAAFETWLDPLRAALHRGGLGVDRAERVALLVLSAAEGALLLGRARRDLSALDAVQAELELLLTAL